ncbi:MAG: hypothetical protein HY812_10315 [Planctomycetes bacterium]|nr:hypothetical protein [Planctomycetota bacterium]
MPRKKVATAKSPAMDFLVSFMKARPKASYGEARQAANRSGHTVYPIMWGRAQVMLGRVKAKKRGSAKAAAAPAAKRRMAVRPGVRKVGRPRKVLARKAPGGSARVVLPIQDRVALESWQSFVAMMNAGSKVALQYDGARWVLVGV